MDRLFMDLEWVRINNESDNNGDTQAPVHVRNIRTNGGSITGRVVRLGVGRFRLDMYIKGEYKETGMYSTPETAFRALSALS